MKDDGKGGNAWIIRLKTDMFQGRGGARKWDNLEKRIIREGEETRKVSLKGLLEKRDEKGPVDGDPRAEQSMLQSALGKILCPFRQVLQD